jgi:hypothetical protein
MADRWDERNRNYEGRQRPLTDRAADEVRSWVGDDEAERRRQMDEMRDDRYDRDRPNPAERGWERTRETFRDMTDRDRDGRRGWSEWNDNDRPGYRGGRGDFTSGSYAAPQNRDDYWNRQRGDYPSQDRAFGDVSRDRTIAPSAGGYVPSPQYDRGDEMRRGWQGPNYAGRGPRGYQRGDERIREDVCDRLTEDPRIDAEDIEVTVNGGEVTLAGTVRSRQEKRSAEDCVEHISGVREVNNNLKVRRMDEVIGTARSGASMLGLSDSPPAPPSKDRK